MVRTQEIPRTATFAWSPATASTLVATGTRAGAVDADFSNDTQLEIWDLGLDGNGNNREILPIAATGTDSRFHDVAWTNPTQDHPQGLIAGALENGSLDLWSAERLWTSQEEAFLSPTAGAKGELYISDLNNIANPYRMGNSIARADDFECLDWNRNVPHIIVTGSSGGFATVWDVKTKKESLTLNNMGRKAISAVAWDPNKHTRLVTAIPYDTDPLILVWDLRNANTPEKVLRGHDGGILSLSWCTQDNDLLISCGKDNRTICWNPQTGEAYGEYPVVTNWTFQTRWNPHNPALFATASFDGKINIHSIQSLSGDARYPTGAPAQAVDDVDFFSTSHSDSQRNTFSLQKAPKWLRRPCGASFGFGGKIVSLNTVGSEEHQVSQVRISDFIVDAGIGEAAVKFERSVQEKDLAGICVQQLSEEANESEKADWKVIKILTLQNPRKALIEHLGFSGEGDQTADGISEATVNGNHCNDSSSEKPKNDLMTQKNRLSAFFENNEGENFLSDFAATKGAKTNNPFQLYSGSESEPDRRITRALLLGNFDRAVEICLQEDRLSDAFMVATCGGPSCIERAQKAYFARKSGGPNYLRLLASVAGKNLWDVAHNADLANWMEVMVILCTYANPEHFPDLCEALGDRLDERTSNNQDAGIPRQEASFCYLAGSKLEKVVGIWMLELQQREKSELKNTSNDSSFGVHARSLQHFIEKVTVLREATNFKDQDLHATSDWKLGLLYDKYIEYANLTASFGQLHVAKRYLDLLPKQYPAAEAARERINQAARRASTETTSKQPPLSGRATHRNQAFASPAGSEAHLNFTRPLPNTSDPRGSASAYHNQSYPQPINAPYRLPNSGDRAKYEPPHQVRQSGIPPPGPGPSYLYQGVGPPPQTVNASPSVPAPSMSSNLGNWNDTPENFSKPQTSRRGTPKAAIYSTNPPYGYPAPVGPSGLPPSVSGQEKMASSLPPPPKGPPRISSPKVDTSSTQQSQSRPPPSAANPYAPQSGVNQTTSAQPQSLIPRGTSPYNPPPSAAPPINRYAPAPYSPREGYSLPLASRNGPMASQSANPYAPQPNLNDAELLNSNDQSRNLSLGQSPGPSIRSSGPSSSATSKVVGEGNQSPRTEGVITSLPRRHPSGDRSHIPIHSRPIFELLDTEMQRVKARAPANFQKQVIDTEKRLNILFDHLNNEDLLKEDTVTSMVQLSQAVQARDYEQAQGIHLDLLTNKTDQCGHWMVRSQRYFG
ncbi:MAG: hypothetical protein Q9219_006692 [cf. Caloplaca sp. 3 TL-2023]